MSFDDFFLNNNWVYSVLIVPLALVFKKQFGLDGRVKVVESNQDIYMKKIDKVCANQESLARDVNQMLGALREHLRNSAKNH